MFRKSFWLFCCFSVIRCWSDAPPNILVFVADDAGMELGCYGDSGATTPHLDALAEGGLVFEQAFVTSPQCSPSRTSMLSGQYAHTIGTEDLHSNLSPETMIVPGYLKEAGYYSGIMLKTHIGSAGMDQFDWYDNGLWPDYLRDGVWNEKAVGNFREFLDRTQGCPFFLWVGFIDPHRPYIETSIAGNRAPEVNDPTQVTVPPYLLDNEGTRMDLAHYYDEVTRMDSHIGAMLTVLKERGLLEHTLVIFLSDNGKPFPRAKGTLYDSGIHIPMIVSWPGVVAPGTRHRGLLSTIDLAPTILDVAGLPVPETMAGQSFLPRLRNSALPGSEAIFAERNWHEADEHMRAIRTDEFLMIFNSYIALPHGSPSDVSTSPAWYELQEHRIALNAAQTWLFQCPRPAVELYDIKKDPDQLLNLSGTREYLPTSRDLSRQLVKWMMETGDHSPNERRRIDAVDRVSGYPMLEGKERHYFED